MSFCIRDLSAEDSWTNTNRIFTSIKKSKHKYMHVYNGGNKMLQLQMLKNINLIYTSNKHINLLKPILSSNKPRGKVTTNRNLNMKNHTDK